MNISTNMGHYRYRDENRCSNQEDIKAVEGRRGAEGFRRDERRAMAATAADPKMG